MGESDENKIVLTFFTLYSPFAIPAAARRAPRGGIRRHERGRRFSRSPSPSVATITLLPEGSFNRIVPEEFSRMEVTQSRNKRIPDHKLFKRAGQFFPYPNEENFG
jgi:hypothetical protein